MNRRSLLAAVYAFFAFPVRSAGAGTCPPPLIFDHADPVKYLFEAQLSNWTRVNPGVTKATLYTPFRQLAGTQGRNVWGDLHYDVVIAQPSSVKPVWWALLPECGEGS